MKYKLNRFEKQKDNKGIITSIFVAINCTDEVSNESVTMEHFLSADEMTSVLNNEVNLKPILTKLCADGCIRLESQIANKPQPTEYGNLDFEADDEEVQAKRVEIEKAKAEAELAKVEEDVVTPAEEVIDVVEEETDAVVVPVSDSVTP